MPRCASPSASSFRLSLRRPGWLPSRSVGPEPAMISAQTAGLAPEARSSVPARLPLPVSRTISSAAAGNAASSAAASRPALENPRKRQHQQDEDPEHESAPEQADRAVERGGVRRFAEAELRARLQALDFGERHAELDAHGARARGEDDADVRVGPAG